MTVSKDLMLAILAMDSYNRGYDAGISDGDANENGLNDAVGTAIGNATIKGGSDSTPDSAEVAAGFYALAYDTDFGTVVSYRGTDFGGITEIDPDVVHGWSVGGGNFFELQALRAAEFLTAVQGEGGAGTAILTGHSLGGGWPDFRADCMGIQRLFLIR